MSSSFNRRRVLQGASLASLLAVAPPMLRAQALKETRGMEGLLVETQSGTLRGASEDGVRAFRGIPFSAPPTGVRRFRAPSPVQSWTGERDATRSGPASWQVNAINAAKVQAIAQTLKVKLPGVRLAPPFAASTYFQPSMSEDCLYLDIWAPAVEPGERLPVYVYYHGGANAGSAGSAWLERGGSLAREERIIVVRPSYRLGALGWVHFGLLDDELGEAVNLGIKDQIAALQWVVANIERFGGDKSNITVGGESAGATAVSHLLTNPQTRPLFRRAIMQSLSPFNQWCTQSRQDAVSVAEIYLQILGIADASDLQQIDADRLVAVSQGLQRYFEADKNCAWRPLGGVVDGTTVPMQPARFLSEVAQPSLPREIMIGFAKDEWQFFRGHSETMKTGSREEVVKILAQVCGPERAQALMDDYTRAHPGHSAAQLLSDFMSLEFFKFPSLKIAQNLARQGVRTHVFQFSYDLPGQGGYLKAYHTGDMPFIWRNYSKEDLARWPAFEGIDRSQLEQSALAFGKLYGGFIRTGDPGPSWPEFEDSGKKILWFGQKVEARSDLLTPELKAFEHAGLSSVAILEQRLAGNTRASLNEPRRADIVSRS